MAEYKDIELLKKQIADFKRVVNSPNSDYLTGYISALSATEGIIAGLPDADVEPVKHGKWLNNDDKWEFYKCSICGNEAYWDTDYGQQLFDFCPWCGAKMGGESND